MHPIFQGRPIIGELPYSGNGTRLLVTQEADVEGLLDKAPIGNLRVLERLREDPHARKLHEACEADAELGRMRAPTLASTEHCTAYVLSPRFSVEQGPSDVYLASWLNQRLACAGFKEDGSPKVRPIDDLSASGGSLIAPVGLRLQFTFRSKWLHGCVRKAGQRQVGPAGREHAPHQIQYEGMMCGKLPALPRAKL